MSTQVVLPQPALSQTAMEGKSPDEYIAMLKRRKTPVLLTFTLLSLLTILLAMLWPPTYQSTARILIEEQDIPQDMVRSTITNYANQQIQVITQRVMTFTNIIAIVEKFGLYSTEELSNLPQMEVVKHFKDAVQLDVISATVVDPRSGRPSDATIAFALAYENSDPRKAQQVTDELATLYLNENLRDRAEQTESTEMFLRNESQLVNAELSEIEEQLAAFKIKNKKALPESLQYNTQNIARLESQLLSAQARLREVSTRENEIAAKLAQTNPYAPTVLPSGEMVMADVDRLKALQSEYRKKAAKYNASHPDIKRLQREIDALSASIGHTGNEDELRRLLQDRKSELRGLKQEYGLSHPDVVAKQRLVEQLEEQLTMAQTGVLSANPDNPTYVYLENQLGSLRMEEAQLRQQVASLQEQVNTLNQSLLLAPGIEKEYGRLQRGFAAAQAKLLDIRQKLRQAELAGALEQNLKGQRFTLIEPAVLPEKPTSPNRPAIIFLGVLLSGALALGVLVVSETLDNSVRTERALVAASGMPVLASIDYIQDQTRDGYLFWVALVGSLLIVSAALLAIHFLYQPLDVLWYSLLRRFGLG